MTGLLILSGDLAANLGFQLSVLAAGGVIAGAGMFRGRRPAAVWTILAATVAAQAAVVPLLLLLRIGSVPVVSPLTNLIAAPLVTIASAVGGVGVALGIAPATDAGIDVAEWILSLSATAAEWPQVGLAGIIGLGVGAAALRVRQLRRPLAVAVVVAVAVAAPRAPSWPVEPTATFLDVGQGDATLLRSPAGHTVLIDGRADPDTLQRALVRRGVRRLDLVVASHGDVDHVGGLEGLATAIPYRELWLPAFSQPGTTLAAIAAEAERRGASVRHRRAGDVAFIGSFHISVMGPRRRYAGDNNGSIVLWVEAGTKTLLLAGDVEAVAQRELRPPRPDVMLVPHHGSSTTDLKWLARTVGPEAIISVGPNRFGHPSPLVVAELDALGVRVRTTMNAGSIDVSMAETGVTRGDLQSASWHRSSPSRVPGTPVPASGN